MAAERRVRRPARRCRLFTPVRAGCLILTFGGAVNFCVLFLRSSGDISMEHHGGRLHELPTVLAVANGDGDAASSPHQPVPQPPPLSYSPPSPPSPPPLPLPLPPPSPTKLRQRGCLEMIRGYWTYEICLDAEVRQFHSYVRGVDRHQLRSLGKLVTLPPPSPASGSLRTDAGEQDEVDDAETDDLRSEAASQMAANAAGTAAIPAFERRSYAGGDVCEPSKVLRQSAVSVYCGQSDRIVDVREPEPCRYEFNVELLSACPPSGEGTRRDGSSELHAQEAKESDLNQPDEEEIARKVAARAEGGHAAAGGEGRLATAFRTPG